MNELQTSEALLRALRESSTRTPSPEQLEKQRLSFVMGILSEGNSMTRAEVQHVLDRQEGKMIAAE